MNSSTYCAARLVYRAKPVHESTERGADLLGGLAWSVLAEAARHASRRRPR